MDFVELAKNLLLLVIGFVLLIKGADYFVEGAASVARKLRVPSLIVGLTIVAMGTSLPECSVSIIASMNNRNSLAISNVIGSNFFNLLMVCGICSLFIALNVTRETIIRDFPFSIICTIVLGIICFTDSIVDRTEGVVLLICMSIFLLLMIFSALSARKKTAGKENEGVILPLPKCALFVAGGIIAIKFGGDFVVDSASKIARMANVSETIIGLTIVACGTSLPELVTSLVAAKKKEVDMAVGNVIGSNILNIAMVLGFAAVISPIHAIEENIIDIIILIVVNALVWGVCFVRKKVERVTGIFMILTYAVYFAYIFWR